MNFAFSSSPPVCRIQPLVAMLLAMASTLVECVPNFSEGRDAKKVDAIVEAMKILASTCWTRRWTGTITGA